MNSIIDVFFPNIDLTQGLSVEFVAYVFGWLIVLGFFANLLSVFRGLR